MTDTSIQPQPSDVPDRIPLARLAARQDGGSRILARVVQHAGERGPGRVGVAAFQSSL